MRHMEALLIVAAAALCGSATASSAAPLPPPAERLSLKPCKLPKEDEKGPVAGGEVEARCGTLSVPENRRTNSGRMLPLRVVIVPATSAKPREPLYFLSGGPGQAATEQASGFTGWWTRQEHDVVLMDVRGTGEGSRLDCAFGGSETDLQAYLEPLFFDGRRYADCRDALSKTADLPQYTTANAMTDLDELRQALGHEKINLEGGSYGTRAALTYIRMFPGRVHAALLSSLVPFENRSPLFHAAAAQRSFGLLVAECHGDPACKAAFPDPHADLRAILDRLKRAPARVTVQHPDTGAPVPLTVSASAFTDGMRVMLYSAERQRMLPLMLKRGREGDIAPFAEAALASSRGFKGAIRTGLLLSFTCTEDTARIRPEEVAKEVGDSFIGDARVRGQMAACAVWPKGDVPADFDTPFTSDVPVLLVSGHLDPVTPPQWGEVAKGYFPNSVHLVLPGGHVPWNACSVALSRQLLRTGTIEGLDPSCAGDEPNPPFALPKG
jgi:pimeloyl-ACP methyl ester carboxylesterase